MGRLLLYFSLVSILMACGTGLRRSFHLEIDRVLPEAYEPIDLEYFETKYGEYDGVVLNMETIIDYYGSEGSDLSWTYAHILKKRHLILNPGGYQELGIQLASKPRALFISIISPDGSYIEYDSEDLKEVKKGNSRYYELLYEHIDKGTIIEENVEAIITTWPYMIEEIVSLQFTEPCEKLSYIFACPIGWNIQAKRIGEDRTTPYVEQLDQETGKKLITYTARDVPAIAEEPFSPFHREIAMYFQFIIKNLRELYYSETNTDQYQFWADHFKAKHLSITANDGSFNEKNQKIRELAFSIIGEQDIDKIMTDKILAYIYDEMDVTGSCKRGNLDRILEERGGDASDITFLMQQLLHALNIKADYLLVHWGAFGYFDETYMSNTELSIPALRINLGDTDYIACPFIPGHPIDHIHKALLEQPALVLRKAENSAYFWTLPKNNYAKNEVHERYELVIRENGTIDVSETKVFEGAQAFEVREEIANLEDEAVDAYVNKLLTCSDAHIDMNLYRVIGMQDYARPLSIEYSYSIANLVSETDHEIIFDTDGLFAPISIKELRIHDSTRRNPIRIYYNWQYSKQISISYPDDWMLKTNITDFELINEFGSLTVSSEHGDGRLLVTQKLFLNQIDAPSEDIQDLVHLIGHQPQFRVPTLIFGKLNL